MTGSKISRFKPGVNSSVHLFAAALLWTTIGTLLLVLGVRWIGPGSAGWFVILGLIAGTLKSLFILDKTARRSVQRIVELQDGTCIGAVYSWKTWMLVFLMMTFGITMRKLSDPGMVIGVLYVAVGWALFFSSRHAWRQWLKWSK
ncbi:MAG: hypothetical protein GQ559_03335 [Desulfobulbaceae bacterium]|nr:hypothetical protein [Desulfobulbaceae bacterium]